MREGGFALTVTIEERLQEFRTRVIIVNRLLCLYSLTLIHDHISSLLFPDMGVR